jgi:hypothetical protein
MNKRLSAITFILLTAVRIWSETVLQGQLEISSRGYEDYDFSGGAVFVEELDAYFEVDSDGSFEIPFDTGGDYTVRPLCPGLVAVSQAVTLPYEGVLKVELDLQIVEMTVRVVQEIPGYIVNLKKSVESIESESADLTDNEYHSLLQDSLREDRGPVIDLGRIIELIRERMEKRREER